MVKSPHPTKLAKARAVAMAADVRAARITEQIYFLHGCKSTFATRDFGSRISVHAP